MVNSIKWSDKIIQFKALQYRTDIADLTQVWTSSQLCYYAHYGKQEYFLPRC